MGTKPSSSSRLKAAEPARRRGRGRVERSLPHYTGIPVYHQRSSKGTPVPCGSWLKLLLDEMYNYRNPYHNLKHNIRTCARAMCPGSDTVESKDDSTPKSASRSRRMVQLHGWSLGVEV